MNNIGTLAISLYIIRIREPKPHGCVMPGHRDQNNRDRLNSDPLLSSPDFRIMNIGKNRFNRSLKQDHFTGQGLIANADAIKINSRWRYNP